jgi:maltose-binding protein MalE
MIYARKFDDTLASLVKSFEKVAADNEDKDFTVIVAFIGGEVEALQSTAADFASTHGITKAILVVPSEQPNGPKNYGIPSDAETSVFLYKGKTVEVAHVLAAGKLDKATAEAIVADAAKIL